VTRRERRARQVIRRQAHVALCAVIDMLRDTDAIDRLEENAVLDFIMNAARLRANFEDLGFIAAATAAEALQIALRDELYRRRAA